MAQQRVRQAGVGDSELQGAGSRNRVGLLLGGPRLPTLGQNNEVRVLWSLEGTSSRNIREGLLPRRRFFNQTKLVSEKLPEFCVHHATRGVVHVRLDPALLRFSMSSEEEVQVDI